MRRPLGALCVGLGALPSAQTFSAVSVWSSSNTAAATPVLSRGAEWGRAVPPARATQAGSGAARSTRVRPRTALGAAKLAVDVGDVKRRLSSAQDRLEKNRELFDEAKLAGELEYLEGVSSEAEFWNDANSARKTLGDLNRLKLQLDRLHRWRGWEADAETVIELCGEEEGGVLGLSNRDDVVTHQEQSGAEHLLSLSQNKARQEHETLVSFLMD